MALRRKVLVHPLQELIPVAGQPALLGPHSKEALLPEAVAAAPCKRDRLVHEGNSLFRAVSKVEHEEQIVVRTEGVKDEVVLERDLKSAF